MFRTIEDMPVVQQPLNMPMLSRLLRRDIDPKSLLPLQFGGGARKSGIITVNFFANGSAGDFSDSVPLVLPTTPLSLVWFMGTIDKNGVVTKGSGLVPGSSFDSGTVLEGCEVFSGAIANYSCDTDNLTIKVTSTDVGHSVFIDAYFYYILSYDDLELQSLGL